MGNIILNEDLQVTTTKISQNISNDLDNLSFYVSKKFNESIIYVALIDNQGTFDIIPLTYSKDASNYKIYCIDCKNELRIKSGKCKLVFFVFDKDLQNCESSTSLTLNIDIDTFNLYHQAYIIRKSSNDIANYYDKIVRLTNMNIELYDKIMKGATENEN